MPNISIYADNETFIKFVSKSTTEQKEIRELMLELVKNKVRGVVNAKESNMG